MNELLLKEKVTGEVLRRYDSLIKGWVNDQIKRMELGTDLVTTEQVETLIQEALSTFDAGPTEEEVRQIVTDAIDEFRASQTPLLTISGLEIRTISEFRIALGGNEDVVLPASIRFKGSKIFYTKDSTESSIDFKDTILWVTWEASTEDYGRLLKFFGEDFRSVAFSYAATEEEVSTDPRLYFVSPPSTVAQEIGNLSTRLDAVEAGFGSVDIPGWIGQVVYVESLTNCKNVNDINALLWPEQDFSSKNTHSTIVFFGKTSGLRLITKSPWASSETEVVRIFVDELAKVRVRYDELGAWVDINSFGNLYSFRSLDTNQEHLEYDPDDKIYRTEYSSLTTISEVQSIVNTATADSLTEARVQEMIDVSVGSAISDSY